MIDSRETTMRLNKLVTGIVAGCAVVVISAMPGLAGQMPHGSPHPATAKAKKSQPGMAADMAAKCQAMMADQEKMMTENFVFGLILVLDIGNGLGMILQRE